MGKREFSYDEIQNVANITRGLSADGVERAKSGHPGLPLGCADIASSLYFNEMIYNPVDPNWRNRDRFVLSGGHGSMLQYSLLHLAGFDLSLEDLKQFRQLNSKTPGHPEYGHTVGVETTTGPLGQGIANAVGMAIAEKMMAARFNRPGYNIVDHYVYAIAGDGCFMEGISAEASSFAGHLKLGKLIVFYDSNKITIEGSTDLTFTESVKDRYLAYGWQVIEIDGHNIAEIHDAIEKAKAETTKPSLIIAKTRIAKGAPTKEGTAESHGAPLGEKEVAGLKEALGLPQEDFYVSDEVQAMRERNIARGKAAQAEWEKVYSEWREKYPELAAEWDAGVTVEISPDLVDKLPKFNVGEKLATRAASGKVLNALANEISNLIGGSADLAPSNYSFMEGKGSINPDDFSGRNFNFGVREHAMGAIVNGISVYGGFRVFCATFLVFSDYMRPAVRLSALMNQPVIYIFTHDSIFVGEDGPTHQPIEHTESLRLIPNLNVYRPADAEETKLAWVDALKRTDGPSALILTRQALPVMEKPADADFSKGGYVIYKENKPLELTLVAAGSEVSLAVEAAKILDSEGIGVRVVSVPCRDEYEKQSCEYKASIIPTDKPILALEMGIGTGWYSISPGSKIEVMSIEEFGRSGKGEEVAAFFGFTPDSVVAKAKELLS